jgi:hypothetical protein
MTHSNGCCNVGKAIPAERTLVGKTDRSAQLERGWSDACASIAAELMTMRSLS